MRLNIDLTTLLLIGLGGWAWWQYRQGAFSTLGGPSDDLMQYRGVQMYDPVWESWWAMAKESEVAKRLQYNGPEQGVEQNYNWNGEAQ